MNALSPTVDATARQFLTNLWGANPDGNLPGVGVVASLHGKAFRQYYARTIAEAVAHVERLNMQGLDVYFAMSLFKNTTCRQAENAIGARSLWLDIDCGEKKAADGKGYATQRDGVAALKGFCNDVGLQKPTYIVSSGFGLHVYWVFDKCISTDEWCEIGAKLKSVAKLRGLIADPSRTADISSVLRVPGTTNFKNRANPKPVVIWLAGAIADLDCFTAALDAALPDNRGTMGANGKPLPALLDELDSILFLPLPPETPEEIAKVRSMLDAISPDVDRATWIKVIWALQSTGWSCAEEMAREWSQRGTKWDEGEFAGVVKSFRNDGGIGFGTLVHIAREYGWTPTRTECGATQEGSRSGLLAERLTGDSGDVLNGKIFASLFRDKLLFVHETNDLLKFDSEAGWLAAPPHDAERAAKVALAQMRGHAAECWKTAPDDNNTKRFMAHVERSSQAQRLYAMIDLAKSEPGMTVSLNEFDGDPWLLGVQNGVIDLRTGRLMPVSPKVRVSKRCNVTFDPDADCPLLKQFLREVQPDKEMRDFLRRFAGYCLTGQVGEHIFLFLYGLGANGKSVFIEIIAWLLGDYAHKIATEMLMQHQRNPQGPSPDIVALKGRRLIYANETEEGRKLANARVKDLTGGDTQTGRVPYGVAAITFAPTHKLVVVGNHKPEITDNSDGMWRRVALTPFEETIPEAKRDPKLLEALKGEGSGILNWTLAGLSDWRANGLQVPATIKAATAAYREEQDIIGDWIGERCETGAGCSAKKGDLYPDYVGWAKENGHQPLAQGRLTRRLNERGYRLATDKRTVHGLALKTSTGFGRNL